MTPQVARIAATRLGNAPRPLRLCYAGQVLRVKGSQVRPERQIGQVGAELIGPAEIAADVEVVAARGRGAVKALGIAGLSVDLTLPPLVPAVCRAAKLDPARLEAVRAGARSQGCGRRCGIRRQGRGLAVAGSCSRPPATLRKALKKRLRRSISPPEAATERAPLGRCRRGGLQRRCPASPSPSIRSRIAASSTTPASASPSSRAACAAELGRGGRYRTGNGETRRERHRLHALYRHHRRGDAGGVDGATALRAGRRATRRRRRVGGEGLCHGRRARAGRRMMRAEAPRASPAAMCSSGARNRSECLGEWRMLR